MGAVIEYSEALDGARFEKTVGEVVSSLDEKAEKIRLAEDAAEEHLHAVEEEREAALAEAEAEAGEQEQKPCGRWDKPEQAAGKAGAADSSGYAPGTVVHGNGAMRPIGEMHHGRKHKWGEMTPGSATYGWIKLDDYDRIYGSDVVGEFDVRIDRIRAEGGWLCRFAESYEAYARQLRGAGQDEKLSLSLSDLTYYGFSEDPALDERIAAIAKI